MALDPGQLWNINNSPSSSLPAIPIAQKEPITELYQNFAKFVEIKPISNNGGWSKCWRSTQNKLPKPGDREGVNSRLFEWRHTSIACTINDCKMEWIELKLLESDNGIKCHLCANDIKYESINDVSSTMYYCPSKVHQPTIKTDRMDICVLCVLCRLVDSKKLNLC